MEEIIWDQFIQYWLKGYRLRKKRIKRPAGNVDTYVYIQKGRVRRSAGRWYPLHEKFLQFQEIAKRLMDEAETICQDRDAEYQELLEEAKRLENILRKAKQEMENRRKWGKNVQSEFRNLSDGQLQKYFDAWTRRMNQITREFE